MSIRAISISQTYLTPPLDTEGITGLPFCRLTDVKKELVDVIDDSGESGESATKCMDCEAWARLVSLPYPECFKKLLLSELLLYKQKILLVFKLNYKKLHREFELMMKNIN